MNPIQRSLFTAARLGDVEGVREALKNGVSARTKNLAGMTPLMMAVRGKKLDTVKELLPLSDVNEMDKDGITALMYAVTYEHEDIVELLVPVSDLEVNNGNEWTAKRWAKERGYSKILEIIEKFEFVVKEREELDNEAVKIPSNRKTKRL